MIKKFNEYITESRLGRILSNSFSENVRDEDRIDVIKMEWDIVEKYFKRRFCEICCQLFPDIFRKDFNRDNLLSYPVQIDFFYASDIINDNDVQIEFHFNLLEPITISTQFIIEDITGELSEAILAAAGKTTYHGKNTHLDYTDYYGEQDNVSEEDAAEDMERFEQVCVMLGNELKELTVKEIEKTISTGRIKKFNESRLGRILNQSFSNEVRREDKYETNIKKMKPVDLGLSVLWADIDMTLNKQSNIYDIDITGFPVIDGWRLPSRQEADELFSKCKKEQIENGNGVRISSKDENSNESITLNRNDSKDGYLEYWETCEDEGGLGVFGIKCTDKFLPHSVFSFYKPFSPYKPGEGEGSKKRVRLVRDKKE